MLTCLLLAFSSSIDSLGIGITYGLRDTNITKNAKIILFIISLIITTVAILLGNVLFHFVDENISNIIGSLVLFFMGIWIIFQSVFNKKKKEDESEQEDNIEKTKESKNIQKKNKKILNFIIKPLGITIRIIKDPISSDLDQSNNIDAKEAIYLGFALSLDSLCVGIGISSMQISPYIFPFLVSIFQLVFLSLGSFIGKKIKLSTTIPSKFFNIISGIILIAIGLIKIF